FRNNSASQRGGAMYNLNSSLNVRNSLFHDNTADLGGAGYHSGSGTTNYTNVTFAENSAGTGGGLYTSAGTVAQIYNCILWDNIATGNGDQVYSDGSVTAQNCIMKINSANVSGTFNQQNTLATNPQFVNAANNNFSIVNASPAANSGNTSLFANAAATTDLAGNPRLTGPEIDRGAYESSSTTPVAPTPVLPIRYVKQGGTGTGSSWADASGELQQMIDESLAGNQVWVARGTYLAEAGATFTMKEGVLIYGGFPSDNNAAVMADRDWKVYNSKLQGNGAGVVQSLNLAAGTLDGFTITGGSASEGGGIYYDNSTTTLKNLIVTGNAASQGGGMYATFEEYDDVTGNWAPPVNLTFENIVLKNNTAGQRGAGVYIYSGENVDITFLNSEISNNTATAGAAIQLYYGKLTMTNVVIASNTAEYDTVISGSSYYSPTFLNCTIVGNTGIEEGGISIYWRYSGLIFRNCVNWGNTSGYGELYENYFGNPYIIENSIYEGTDTSDGNINSNPFFVDQSGGNYRLAAVSPAIDSGNTAFYPDAATATDLSGYARINGTAIDRGAYEYRPLECGEIVTQWTGTEWLNGAPISSQYRAIIDGDYNSEINGRVDACSLTVNGGDAVVKSGDIFTIQNAVTVAPGASLTFENNAHLMQAIAVNMNSGNIVMHRNSSLLYRQDYTLWSSPVAGQNIRSFASGTVLSRFYNYNTTTDHYESLFATEGASSGIDFATGKGYLIRMPNGATEPGYIEGTTAIRFDGTFTGVPNNGTIAVNVIPQSGSVQGFNAIGNPYPSPISVPAFFAGNAGNTTGVMYLWRRRNGSDQASAYCTINAQGEFVDNQQPETENPDNVIQTGQGFIVKALTGTVNFNNGMRAGSLIHDDSFFRNSSNTEETVVESHRIWLNLSKENTPLAQMMVGYKSNATMGIDMGIDAPFINDVETGLNSLLEGSAYAIQGRPLPFVTQDIVPLQFKANTAGNYAITIDHVDGLFLGGQDILLKDNLLGTTHSLKESGYSFTSDAGVYDNRFEIVYGEALGTDKPVVDANTIIIYKQERNLVINSGNATMANVKIFDIRGRMVYERNNINAGEMIISDLRAEEQMLIVQITTTENGKVSKKVIF
ncbi:MAG: T9SS sorting signal type C domain-containing protein, partial [Flavobacterium sp.]